MKKGTCVHFNGIHNDTCEIGINYTSLVGGREGGWTRHLPCFESNSNDRHVTCDQYREPTEQELADFEEEIQARLKMLNRVMPLILELKREYKRRDATVARDCPICGGKLHMSIAACNGHVWGICDTPGCLSWVE